MWYVILVMLGSTAHQTDWMGGDSVLGPVSNWGTQYWMSDSVTAATPGQVSLIATSWNYSNWVKHVVESNSGIQAHTQGLMPADVDGDGIVDLVAHTNDQVVWYKHDGNYNFTKYVIGAANDGGGDTPCVYPCDLDQDGDIDVLVATEGVGVGWYENQNLTWVWYSLDNSTGYHRPSSADVELDGDIDVIVVDGNSFSGYWGDIYLFRNNGSQVFTKELLANLPSNEGWRVYPQDFNQDGYSDVYSVLSNTYIFLNDGTGYFTQSWNGDFWAGASDFDGAWPSDIDMDGDIDLVCGGYNGASNYEFYALLNDGTGTNFTLQSLTNNAYYYVDGAIARDIDLDGWPDIAGTWLRVGWFRQNSSNPLTFTLHDIEACYNSHWIYAAPLRNMCIPSIDLLVTGSGAHIVYENNMLLGFASIGYLESSILELTQNTMQPCTLKYFAYNACVPNDTSLCFYWRAGSDSANIVSNPWNGPYYATIGANIIDSFALSGTARMFQYKSEFRGNPNDIAVLYEVWLTYECSGAGIEEDTYPIHTLQLQFIDNKLVLYLPQEDDVSLIIYDIAGRVVKNVIDGYLPAGKYEFDTPKKPGVYFAKVFIGRGEIECLKFIKLR